MAAAAGSELGKAGLGAGLGALGGAVGGSGQDIRGFGANETDQIHPANLLNFGVEGIKRLGRAATQQAEEPINLGPQSIVQTPPFFFGGGLPGPIGLSGRDPGFASNRNKNDFLNPFQDEGVPPRTPSGSGGGGDDKPPPNGIPTSRSTARTFAPSNTTNITAMGGASNNDFTSLLSALDMIQPGFSAQVMGGRGGSNGR